MLQVMRRTQKGFSNKIRRMQTRASTMQMDNPHQKHSWRKRSQHHVKISCLELQYILPTPGIKYNKIMLFLDTILKSISTFSGSKQPHNLPKVEKPYNPIKWIYILNCPYYLNIEELAGKLYWKILLCDCM